MPDSWQLGSSGNRDAPRGAGLSDVTELLKQNAASFFSSVAAAAAHPVQSHSPSSNQHQSPYSTQSTPLRRASSPAGPTRPPPPTAKSPCTPSAVSHAPASGSPVVPATPLTTPSIRINGPSATDSSPQFTSNRVFQVAHSQVPTSSSMPDLLGSLTPATPSEVLTIFDPLCSGDEECADVARVSASSGEDSWDLDLPDGAATANANSLTMTEILDPFSSLPPQLDPPEVPPRLPREERESFVKNGHNSSAVHRLKPQAQNRDFNSLPRNNSKSYSNIQSRPLPPRPLPPTNSGISRSTSELVSPTKPKDRSLNPGTEQLRLLVKEVAKSVPQPMGVFFCYGFHVSGTNRSQSQILVRFFSDDQQEHPLPDTVYVYPEDTASTILNLAQQFDHFDQSRTFVKLKSREQFLPLDRPLADILFIQSRCLVLGHPLDVRLVDRDYVTLVDTRLQVDVLNSALDFTYDWGLASNIEYTLSMIDQWEQELDTSGGDSHSATATKLKGAMCLLTTTMGLQTCKFSAAVHALKGCPEHQYTLTRRKAVKEAREYGRSLLRSFKHFPGGCDSGAGEATISSEHVSDLFRVRVDSVSRLCPSMTSQVSELTVELAVVYNDSIQFRMAETCLPRFPRDQEGIVNSGHRRAYIQVDQTFPFVNHQCFKDSCDSTEDLPGESQEVELVSVCEVARECLLRVSLFGRGGEQKKLLAAASFALFTNGGVMNTDQMFLPLWPADLPGGVPVKSYPYPPIVHLFDGSEVEPPIVLLQVINSTKSTITAPPLHGLEEAATNCKPLHKSEQSQVDEVLKRKHVARLDDDSRELVWMRRNELLLTPGGAKYLPDILECNDSGWNFNWTSQLPQMLALVEGQTKPWNALSLLLARFSDSSIRAFAARHLSEFTDGEIIALLPVLTECLKYELYPANDLIKFLFTRARSSLSVLVNLYRSLKTQASVNQYSAIFTLYITALLRLCSDELQVMLLRQDSFVKLLHQFYTEKFSKSTDYLKIHLKKINSNFFDSSPEVYTCWPVGESVIRMDAEKSFLHEKSKAKPMHLLMNTKAGGVCETLFKFGDDLRQDQLIVLLMNVMNYLWLHQGLDLKFVSYGVFPCSDHSGFIQVVPDAVTLCQLQTSFGGLSAFKTECIHAWLHQKNSQSEQAFEAALENFTLSTAAYCVATFILGVCDRHNDNIMVLPSGHLFHIDYGKIFGDTENFGFISRDRTAMVLTKDMLYAICRGDIGDSGTHFHHFVDQCCAAYNAVRRQSDLFIRLVALSVECSLGQMKAQQVLEFVVQRLCTDLTDSQAIEKMTCVINESREKSIMTSFNFMVHSMAHNGLSATSTETFIILGFAAPTVQWSANTPQIAQIEVQDAPQEQMGANGNTFCVYPTIVTRVDPATRASTRDVVFRRYSDYEKLHNVLCSKFERLFADRPFMSTMDKLHLDKNYRRSQRAKAIQAFVSVIVGNSKVLQTHYVATFFQTLPVDQHFTIKRRSVSTGGRLAVSNDSLPGVNRAGSRGVINLDITLNHTRTEMTVLVKNCKNLSLPGDGGLPPTNVYVKLKVLPEDQGVQSKQKTSTIYNDCNPLFNNSFTFDISRNHHDNSSLEVSVCHYSAIGKVGSGVIGKLRIPLSSLSNTNHISQSIDSGSA